MRTLLYLITLLFLLTFSFASHAALTTVEFTATVEYLDDPDNALASNIKVGDQISGTYTLDLAKVDGEPSPEIASYVTQPPLAPFLGFKLDIPNLTYTPNNDVADLNLFIQNGTNDHYSVMSCCSDIASFSNGSRVDNMSLYLTDNSGETLTEADINTNPAVLNTFPDKHFMMYGRSETGSSFQVEASVFKIGYPAARCEAPADTNTVSFWATVYDISGSAPAAIGVNLGDPITGKFKLDPTKPDLNPTSDHAYYEYPLGDTSGNVEITLAGSNFIGDPNQHHFEVQIGNSMAGYGLDYFNIKSERENMPLPSGAIIQDVYFDFNDSNSTALNVASIPESIPTSVEPWMQHDIILAGSHPDGSYFIIRAKVDTVYHNLALSASPLTISPASGIFIPPQHFRPAFILDSDVPPLGNYTVTLEANGVSRNVICDSQVITLDNRQAVYCDTIGATTLEQGINTLKVEVELLDGSIHTGEAAWELLP